MSGYREMGLLLSIAIETYNQEDYIKQTLDSILSQDYWFDYEIVIGEDCSTDSTPQIVDDYARKYPQIRVIHNSSNLGAMGNYYNVLKNCFGKYFMDCAGDDFWLPGKVRAQIEFMENNPEVGMYYGKVKRIDSLNNMVVGIWGKKVNNTYEVMHDIGSIPPVTMCIRKEALDKYINEIEPQKKAWLMEDYPFYLWATKNINIIFEDSYFATYRVIENSVSHPVSLDKRIHFMESVKDVKLYFNSKYNIITNDEIEDMYVLDVINTCFDLFFETNQYIYQEKIISFSQKLKCPTLKMRVKVFVAKYSMLLFIARQIKLLKHFIDKNFTKTRLMK